MIYRDFKGMKIPRLAMGCMRLPVIDGKDADIDIEQTQKMVDYAMSKGVNYFDTAWDYHGRNSQSVIGEALKKYPRESFYLAHKFPGYNLRNMPKVQSIFEQELEACQVDYFDFYMFHNVCELNIEQYLDEQYGIYDYLTEQVRNGRIKHLGFSAHGEYDCIKRFLEAYGDAMEFAQIQVNYLDYEFQGARKKLELLAEYNIPVWVMEPMRGGRLAKLSPSQEAKLKALRPDESIAAWAHRFLQGLPQVVTVLTGASDFEQFKDNVATFEEEKLLNDEEMAALKEVTDEMLAEKTVPCTACNYCIKYCPKKLEIPKLISLYNEHNFTDGGFIAPFVVKTMDDDKKPDNCIACGACEKVCPQKLPISETIAAFAELIEKSPL